MAQKGADINKIVIDNTDGIVLPEKREG